MNRNQNKEQTFRKVNKYQYHKGKSYQKTLIDQLKKELIDNKKAQ